MGWLLSKMEMLGSIGGGSCGDVTFPQVTKRSPAPWVACGGSATGFHQRAIEALKTFETATRMPARLILMGDLRQLPLAMRETCRKNRSMSDSAIRCSRWHGEMREAACKAEGFSRAVCDQGLLTVAVALRAHERPLGLVEFGPLPQTSCASCEAALALSRTLVRDLEREACATLDRTSHGIPEPVRRAIDFIGKNLTFSLSLTTVAQAASLSPGHFSRIFRSTTGQSLSDYLSTARMHRACALLAERPHARISEVAMDCGFGSIPHFNRQFRKVTGKTPGEFRSLAKKAGWPTESPVTEL